MEVDRSSPSLCTMETAAALRARLKALLVSLGHVKEEGLRSDGGYYWRDASDVLAAQPALRAAAGGGEGGGFRLRLRAKCSGRERPSVAEASRPIGAGNAGGKRRRRRREEKRGALAPLCSAARADPLRRRCGRYSRVPRSRDLRGHARNALRPGNPTQRDRPAANGAAARWENAARDAAPRRQRARRGARYRRRARGRAPHERVGGVRSARRAPRLRRRRRRAPPRQLRERNERARLVAPPRVRGRVVRIHAVGKRSRRRLAGRPR